MCVVKFKVVTMEGLDYKLGAELVPGMVTVSVNVSNVDSM